MSCRGLSDKTTFLGVSVLQSDTSTTIEFFLASVEITFLVEQTIKRSAFVFWNWNRGDQEGRFTKKEWEDGKYGTQQVN